MSTMSVRLSNDLYHSLPAVKSFVDTYCARNYGWLPEESRILSVSYRFVLRSLVETALYVGGFHSVDYDVNFMSVNKLYNDGMVRKEHFYRDGAGSRKAANYSCLYDWVTSYLVVGNLSSLERDLTVATLDVAGSLLS